MPKSSMTKYPVYAVCQRYPKGEVIPLRDKVFATQRQALLARDAMVEEGLAYQWPVRKFWLVEFWEVDGA